MSQQEMVLFAIGPDRPGLVKEISSLIHESGGNLEDSRMAVLAGDFALIVLFAGAAEAIRKVREGCQALERKLGFSIELREPTRRKVEASYLPYRLRATGTDQPGIVHRLSEVLAAFNVNVISLESRLTQAAFHGTALFTLSAEIHVSNREIVEELHDQLEKTSRELHLICDLEPIE